MNKNLLNSYRRDLASCFYHTSIMMHFQNPVPINLHQNIPHFSSFSPPLPSFLMFVEMATIMYAQTEKYRQSMSGEWWWWWWQWWYKKKLKALWYNAQHMPFNYLQCGESLKIFKLRSNFSHSWSRSFLQQGFKYITSVFWIKWVHIYMHHIHAIVTLFFPKWLVQNWVSYRRNTYVKGPNLSNLFAVSEQFGWVRTFLLQCLYHCSFNSELITLNKMGPQLHAYGAHICTFN